MHSCLLIKNEYKRWLVNNIFSVRQFKPRFRLWELAANEDSK